VQGQEVCDDGAESSVLTANKSKYNKSQKYVGKNDNSKPGKCNPCKNQDTGKGTAGYLKRNKRKINPLPV